MFGGGTGTASGTDQTNYDELLNKIEQNSQVKNTAQTTAPKSYSGPVIKLPDWQDISGAFGPAGMAAYGAAKYGPELFSKGKNLFSQGSNLLKNFAGGFSGSKFNLAG
jgi:hypothetical protein